MGKVRKRHTNFNRNRQSRSRNREEYKPITPEPLYLARNFEDLSKLINDDIIQGLRNIQRLPGVAHRMLLEIHQLQNDQEKMYIIGKRYLKVMDHYFANIHDKVYLELRYGTEYRQIKSMIAEVEDELKARYNSMATYMEEEFKHTKKEDMTSSDSGSSELVYLPQAQDAAEKERKAQEKPLFSGQEVAPVELFNAIMMEKNILVVDTRRPDEFKESKINIQYGGKLINIPQDIIVPGLSANTLGQQLDPITQEIWNNRDNFDAIILMDWDTDSINYPGSKLERLRHIIVEWDFNRSYRQAPVLLNGGYKEFIEWYPSEVTNSSAYLSQTNSEIDELLTIDDVSYPEIGSAAGNMNLKMHSVSSFGDVQARIARDFGPEEAAGPAARASRSEGELPKDFYVQQGKSAYRSLSEESLPKEFYAVESFDPLPAGEPKEKEDDKGDKEKSDEVKSAIEGDRAELLREARALPKPGASPRAEPKDVIIRNLIAENKELFVKPTAPTVDRTFKPALVQPRGGQGYTGIRNIRNNCYISCMLQSLKVIPIIRSLFVISNNYIKHVHKHPPYIAMHFASVMKILWEGTQKRPKVYNPHVLLQKIYDLNKVYAKGNHEDTFEFFICLFNHLSEDCSFDLPRPKIMTEREKSWFSQLQGRCSFFIDLTYYQLKNTRVCWNCQKPSYVFDSDSSLMLSVPDDKESTTLEELLKEYLKENLVADYSCAECKSTATIVNRKEIVLDPEILIIVLKRYTATKDGSIKKVETEVSFPEDNLEFGNSSYKLYSIPQHSGTMTAGHYYTSALVDADKDHWVMFNDERATRHNVPITEVPGIKSGCVGFFYVRQGAAKSVS